MGPHFGILGLAVGSLYMPGATGIIGTEKATIVSAPSVDPCQGFFTQAAVPSGLRAGDAFVASSPTGRVSVIAAQLLSQRVHVAESRDLGLKGVAVS